MKYYIVTFGCQQNVTDSERIASYLSAKGMVKATSINQTDQIVVNTCMVREMAENRVYGLVHNITKLKEKNQSIKTKHPKIIITGCMVGMAMRDKTGKFLKLLKERLPSVDEFLPIEEIGFDHPPLRSDKKHAWIPISNGCNNFCTFCVVPFTRGREVSRPYKEILCECKELVKKGYKKITLLGMNVNSYGADLLIGQENVQVLRDIDKTYFKKLHVKQISKGENTKLQFNIHNTHKEVKPVYVKHLGRFRIPTLFPYLLEDICNIEGLKFIDFMSSNPWDFSDELIDVIARHSRITRKIHFALQSGSNSVLKRMNRWYTKEEYLNLLNKIRLKIPNIQFSTDIIVGFCGETDEEFKETVDLVKKARFYKAYISIYSDRPMTAAHKVFKDDIPHQIKKKRWRILEELINTPNLKSFVNKKINKNG